MNKNSADDTIVAVSTPVGEGGIGIVRVSGSEALNIAERIFISKSGNRIASLKTHTVHYGHIVDASQKMVDEVLLTVMKAPKTYTKEDTVEINCHGGMQAVKEVLDLIIRCGARVAEPGEFTKRAFLSGRIDLAQAEAVLDLIKAKTDSSLKAAMNQLEGQLSEAVNALLDKTMLIASRIEALVDFPEEELDIISAETMEKTDEVIAGLKHLIDTSSEGIVLRQGILAVICGKPNAGKSSLMNLLLKRDRVIVTPIPGTTRDAVEETINLKGIPIRLVDTAGIGRTDNMLDKEGIKRSKSYIDMADMVFLIFDASVAMDGQDIDSIRLAEKKKKIVIINKIDLPRKIDDNQLKGLVGKSPMVEISVEKKTNIASLEKAIADMIWRGEAYQGQDVIVTNARHQELLDKSLQAMLSVRGDLKENLSPELISVDLRDAAFNMGLIVGRSVSDEILNRIFEQFCIGK